MKRRTLLTSLAALAGTTAGCIADGPGSGDTDRTHTSPSKATDTSSKTGTSTGTASSTESPSPTDSASPTDSSATPSVTDRRFESTGQCNDPGSATVTAEGSTVTVDGCIVGQNACTKPRLVSARYDSEKDRLTVVVGTREERGTDQACAEVLVHLGYRATVSFDGGAPGEVVVVHDGARGRREVARTRTDGA